MTAASVSHLKRGKRREYAENGYYREPRRLVDALFDREIFSGRTFDGACGGGTIVSAGLDRGLDITGSDLVDRGFPCEIRDFFTVEGPIDNIVSNPDFEHAELFARHALAITERKVALLVRLAFYADARCRDQFFEDFPVSRIWVAIPRPTMPPGRLSDGSRDHNGALVVPKATGGSMLYCWLIWDLLEPVPFTRIERL